MKHRTSFVFALLLALLAALMPAAPTAVAPAAGVYFDDSQPGLSILGNAKHYEIGFRMANGSIAYIPPVDAVVGEREIRRAMGQTQEVVPATG